MKTRTFITLLERALEIETGEVHDSREVPYDPKPGDMSVPVEECLGFVLVTHVHMAAVAARAMYLIWQDNDGEWNDDADKDEALGDFADLMSGMRVAPYMDWHCAYFPGITRGQYESNMSTDQDADNLVIDPNIDPKDGSFIPN